MSGWNAQADRDGQALEFAQRYQASALCAANARDLQHDLEQREVSAQIAKELRARQGTSTPFYFGVKTILKVGPLSPGAPRNESCLPCQHALLFGVIAVLEVRPSARAPSNESCAPVNNLLLPTACITAQRGTVCALGCGLDIQQETCNNQVNNEMSGNMQPVMRSTGCGETCQIQPTWAPGSLTRL